jgi:hypothetical protein
MSQEYVQDEFRRSRVVVFAICAAMASVYLLFLYLSGTGRPVPDAYPSALRTALWLAAFGDVAAIAFVRRIILRGRSAGDVEEKIGALKASDWAAAALAEAPAVYGLVLFMAGGSSADFYAFFSLALAASAVFFPRYGRWTDYLSGR